MIIVIKLLTTHCIYITIIVVTVFDQSVYISGYQNDKLTLIYINRQLGESSIGDQSLGTYIYEDQID